jgi:hypothetical protein
MKGLAIFAIIVSALILWGILYKNTEPFVPEFLEQAGVKRTAETKASSYEQRTNHMIPPAGPNVPIQGLESTYRVNAYNSFIV